eukprot:gnl/MRDRNA2_/MRDRNA2_93079_c0_seq1.p1 gnl/MRDRNA2_/MRDRNA2_93079_c0~~gnl/MRDRNA2_/MRDRNA2_93079_c0_seq1.p1  ORF type:complete len:1047 (-),score=205.85 gnl/MRDRNA2_/MRDRNA2_93079_c0_seq1:46-3186(-)
MGMDRLESVQVLSSETQSEPSNSRPVREKRPTARMLESLNLGFLDAPITKRRIHQDNKLTCLEPTVSSRGRVIQAPSRFTQHLGGDTNQHAKRRRLRPLMQNGTDNSFSSDDEAIRTVKRPKLKNPAVEARLMKYNENKEIRQEAQRLSMYFFAGMREVLRPFVSPQVAAALIIHPVSNPQQGARKPLLEQPACIVNCTLRDYQLDGLNWMIEKHDAGVNMLLGDEMGLGKTLQSITLLGYLKTVRECKGPHLVVAPLSVLATWCSEMKKFCPSLRLVRLHSASPKERGRLKSEVLNNTDEFDVVATTYEMCKSMQTILQRIFWNYLIVDEAHVLKNNETEIHKVVASLHTTRILLLTGTPLQNNLHELWSILKVLHPHIFNDSSAFDKSFDLQHHVVDKEMLTKAHHMMEHLMKRRTKMQVECTIMPKEEMKLYCPSTSCQKFWTEMLLVKNEDVLMNVEQQESAPNNPNLNVGKIENQFKRLKSLLVQLRKVSNHPYLISEPDFDGTTGEDLVETSGKLMVLDKLLPALQRAGHRVVLFSQYTMVLDILEDYAGMRGYTYRRLDGQTNRIQRNVDVAAFNAKDSNIFVYFVSTRAGGLGLNLQTADTCVLFDSDWNPQADMQAMARVHRIGQTKKVHVYRLVTRGTVEERIVQRAEKKLFLDQMVNRDSAREGNLDEDIMGLANKDVLSLLKFGAHASMHADVSGLPSDEAIQSLIDRTRDASQKQCDLLVANTQESAAEFDPSLPFMSLRMFSGKYYEKKATKTIDEIQKEWAAANPKRQKAERLIKVGEDMVLKENMYGMEEGYARSKDLSEKVQSFSQPQRRCLVAGRDYQHDYECFNCGGDATETALSFCSLCPAAYHNNPDCGGSIESGLKSRAFICPQHRCWECNRSTADAGGMLFRCISCPSAFCEDCLPITAEIVTRSLRWEGLGLFHSSRNKACYITCSDECVKNAEEDRVRRLKNAEIAEKKRLAEAEKAEKKRAAEEAKLEKAKVKAEKEAKKEEMKVEIKKEKEETNANVKTEVNAKAKAKRLKLARSDSSK